MSSAIDYNAVIKTIVIINDGDIWTVEQGSRYIMENYDVASLPYGQVFHIDNNNHEGAGEGLQMFYAVYERKVVFTGGDQIFLLDYDLTKNITDIRSKYPEYHFSDQFIARVIPKDIFSTSEFQFFKTTEESEIQSMEGYISCHDVFLKKLFGGTLSEHYSVYVDPDTITISNKLSCTTEEYEYDENYTLLEPKSIADVIEELE